jgi:hypothetical protein
MSDIKKTAAALERREFKVKIFKTAEDAKQAILDMIPKDKSAGAGGSQTLVGMGVLEALRERGNTVFSAYLAKKFGEDEKAARACETGADYYLTSSNAVTESGKLYNTDGAANRVSSMFYGPGTIIVVAGKNKIVKNITAARARIKSVAAPLNAKRLECGTPCVKSGKCEDCDSEDRICRITVIHEWAPKDRDMYVFLVNEDLGF